MKIDSLFKAFVLTPVTFLHYVGVGLLFFLSGDAVKSYVGVVGATLMGSVVLYLWSVIFTYLIIRQLDNDS